MTSNRKISAMLSMTANPIIFLELPVTKPALRRTGVAALGDMAWGSHVCMFYESKEDLLDTIVPYFTAGLESKEFCLWAPSDPITLEEAHAVLGQRIKAFDRHLALGNMEIVAGREWYLKGDQFDLKRIANGWGEKLQGALAKG
jgi:MEDS: MEthanogen/methylotroph, DcmR Sensory domain